ncbi:MAG: DUF899 domain-containing protein [Isosphaera sp.]|nr:DUF899 domain-containing protein [Isosphaera sp.]
MKTGFPEVVDQATWQKQLAAVTAKEKAATKALDALAAERRKLPMVSLGTAYTFDSPAGKKTLLDLFEGRKQLIVYHFMFAPSVGGWPTAGCVGCSLQIDQIGHLAHLHARDTSFTAVSLAPLGNIEAYKKRMGWTVPWVSSANTTFNMDLGITTEKGEDHGLSVFIRDGEAIYRTYFTHARGTESIGTVWSLLDVTPLGRQEKWQDAPEGRPQGEPYSWWRRHDEYGKAPGCGCS